MGNSSGLGCCQKVPLLPKWEVLISGDVKGILELLGLPMWNFSRIGAWMFMKFNICEAISLLEGVSSNKESWEKVESEVRKALQQ